ncbi:MAG: FAD-dependent oxidoreductase [Chloroflexi bacterium]|nr:FAD-dependent oxidoreductase [Chloroflexota bacterium]
MRVSPNYDLVVIGAGSAGLTAASFAARLGARVALVERHRIGGDCTWTGCVPSKALLKAAKVAQDMRRAAEFGLPPVYPTIDLKRVMARVRGVIESVYQFETPEALGAKGIDVILGAPRFVDPTKISVDGRVIHAKHFIICTGANPFFPTIPGLADTPCLTYESIFGLEELPRRLIVLGAGPVGVELAQAFQRLGSSVTLIGRPDRILPIADREASAVLADQLSADGVRILTGAEVTKIESRDGALLAFAGKEECAGDALLVAVGRWPNVGGLELERAEIDYTAQGIRVDAHLHTSQRHIYACGDVIGSFQFSHYAGWQGAMAARNALLPGSSRGIRPTVPWVVFTDPEIGQVGISEKQSRDENMPTKVHRWPLERIDRAQTEGEHDGFLKLITGPNGRLLGGTVVASSAGELINELSLAIEKRLNVSHIATTIHAYPTYGFGIQQASAEAVASRLINGWRKRLLSVLVRR